MDIQDKIHALRESQIACGLTDEQIEWAAAAFKWSEFQSDETVFQMDDSGDSLMVIVEGRVKITATQPGGGERFVDHLSAGEHFGEISVLTGHKRAITVTTVMDTRLLELGRDEFQRLMKQVPGLAANLSRALGFRLRRETTGQKIRNVSRVIGIVNDPNNLSMGAMLIKKLAQSLVDEGAIIRVITDCMDSLPGLESIKVSELPRNMSVAAKSDWVQQRLSEQNSYDGHTLVCLSYSNQEELRRMLVQCGQIIWLSGISHEKESRLKLQSLLNGESRLAARLHWGWLLREGTKPENIPSSPMGLGLPDFKIVLGDSNHSSRLERMSISRLVRSIRKLGLVWHSEVAQREDWRTWVY